MKREIILSLFFILVIFISGCSEKQEVNSFEECVAAGYPVMESYPPMCRSKDGQIFTEDSCQFTDGEVYILTISDAKNIAMNSECGSNFKSTYLCNENTGTYWIDLNLEEPGCSPACVVNVKTREAEINWRCTGLIPE